MWTTAKTKPMGIEKPRRLVQTTAKMKLMGIQTARCLVWTTAKTKPMEIQNARHENLDERMAWRKVVQMATQMVERMATQTALTTVC